MKNLKEYLSIFLLFLALGVAYLYPGMGPFFSGSATAVMSDGTDPATLPFAYSQLKRVATESPLDLFYGALPNPVFDAPEGGVAWMPWNEKFIALIALPFIPIEQVATWVVWILLALNGLCFFALARQLDWPKALSISLAICWAFNSFTHARAQVHNAMVGLYFLPLVFLGLVLLQKKTGRHGLLLAALCFLGASLALHYFLILTAVMTPFILWFYFADQKTRADWKKNLGRLVLTALPAILLLLWSLTHTAPREILEKRSSVLPTTGDFKNERGVHPFVETYASRGIDYLGGDTGLGVRDLNPLRYGVTSYILQNLEGSNPHERANGIRWWLLFLSATIALWVLLPARRKSFVPPERSYYVLFLCFGVWAFWLSLSPIYFGAALGPAAWIHWLVPQVRVPSRAGIFVHFATLMIAGYFLNSWLYQKRTEFSVGIFRNEKLKKTLRYAPVLPLLALLSFPPLLNSMPISPVQPAYRNITGPESAGCGTGMYFPYVSGNHALLEHYHFIQRLRGTHCSALNANEDNARNRLMLQSFPLHPQVIQALQQNNAEFSSAIVTFAKCTGIQWMVFDSNVPLAWRQGFCQAMGWNLTDPEVCMATLPHKALLYPPEQCIRR